MDILKKILPKKKNKVIVEEQSEDEVSSYEDEPGRAALIVNDSIANGQFSDIGNQLEKLPSTGFHRTQYVFDIPGKAATGWLAALCICFAVAFLYFAIMGMEMHLYSDKYEMYSMAFLGVAAAVIAVNAFLIACSVNFLKFARRYEKYVEMFKYKNLEIVDDINHSTKFGFSRIVKDLSIAVNQKLIPEGHFTSENLVFIASDELYAKYEENRPEYDRYYKKLIEERARIEERSEEIQQILDIGKEYIDKIRDSNRLIKDKTISDKLDKMEGIVSTIFREVDINPRQSGKLGMFLNYYLPTTDKLLSTYIDVDEKKIEVEGIRNAKQEIERGLDMLIVSFEGILNQFYEEQEMDVASDISAMEMIMDQEKNGRQIEGMSK